MTPGPMPAAGVGPSMATPAEPAPRPPSATRPVPAPTGSADEIFARIERLAELRQKGILTEEEFTTKKGELLARL